MARLALLLALAFTPGCVTVVQEAPDGPRRGRHFRPVSRPTPIERLMFDLPGPSRVVEVGDDGLPATDTLDVWVQHCAPRCVVPDAAQAADLVLSCYPTGAKPWARERHVLPYHAGKVWVYVLPGGLQYVSAGREPLYDRVMEALGLSAVEL